MRASLTIALLLLAVLATAAQAASAAASGPACDSGPERVGDTIVGTPCADVIVAPAGVEVVKGGGGNDTIIGSVTTAASGSPETGLHLEVGSQTFEGGPGNDIVYGDRGNDTLRGNGGNDRLYGGIGDDVLEGGEGDDLLSGGFGADKIDGQAGNDYVRGDATIDHIFDTGGGFDTLSFATGATPGFFDENQERNYPAFSEYGLPGTEGERGVYVNLAQGFADDHSPNFGGGIDEIEGASFERVVGSAFADYIVGTSASQTIYGGGGGDVILGGGGVDTLVGGAGGNFLEAEAGTVDGGAADNCSGGATQLAPCGGSAKHVTQKAASEVAVGIVTMGSQASLYVVGSNGNDAITATYEGASVTVSAPGRTFELGEGCSGAGPVTCMLIAPLDAVLLAGMDGNDTIVANGFPDGVGVVAIGGNGEDTISGGASEDVLVDGPGPSRDQLFSGAGDDALTHNGGPDLLDGGEGSDLFLSVSICDGETIDGGTERIGAPTPDRDNASWARLGSIGVDARLDQFRVGEVGANDEPKCSSGTFDTLSRIEDLEGSNQSDVLYGDEGANQLLGHKGEDTYFALGGNDNLLANSGSRDRVIDCGPGLDQAIIDFASIGDPTPIECERVGEGAAEEFKELELLSEPPPPPPPPDTTPPRTRITAHPPKLVWTRRSRRRVVFRFTSSERGSRFRCKLDRKPFRACASPRAYTVALGRHRVRIVAIDASGNADPTPASFSFRVRRR